MSAGQPMPAACATCGAPIDLAGAYRDSAMRTVCGPCHSKDQLDQIDITSMEDELAVQRARQRKLILRVVGITIGLLLVLLGTLGR